MAKNAAVPRNFSKSRLLGSGGPPGGPENEAKNGPFLAQNPGILDLFFQVIRGRPFLSFGGRGGPPRIVPPLNILLC